MAEDKGPGLKDLTDKLSEEAIRQKVSMPNRKALMSFDYGGVSAGSYNAMLKEAASYVKHQAKTTSNTDLSDEVALGKAEEYLDAAFQSEGGAKGAYKIARKDLVGVIQRLGKEIEDQEAVRHKKSVFSKVDPYDFDSHVRLASQYLDMTKGMAGDVKARRPEDLAHEWRNLALTYANLSDAARSSVEYLGPVKKAA